MINRNLLPINLFLVIISIILFIFPDLDIKASSLFYDNINKTFIKNNIIINFLYFNIHYFIIFPFLLLIIGYLYNKYSNKVKLSQDYIATKKKLLFLFVVLLIGPGLIVNSIFKENFGRARPDNTLIFNGDKKFNKAWTINNQCYTNCSFPSGHSSAGFFVISLAFCMKNRNRFLKWLSFGILCGLISSIGRIAQGDHFLSDTIASWLIINMTCTLIAKKLKPEEKNKTTN